MSSTTEDGDEQAFFDAVDAKHALYHEGMAEGSKKPIGALANGCGLENASDGTSAVMLSKSKPAPSDPPPILDERPPSAPPSLARRRKSSLRSQSRYTNFQSVAEPVPPIPPRFLQVQTLQTRDGQLTSSSRKSPRVQVSRPVLPALQVSSPFQKQTTPLTPTLQPLSPHCTSISPTTTATPAPLLRRNLTQFPGDLAHYELTRTPVANGCKSCPSSPKSHHKSLNMSVNATHRPENFDGLKVYRRPENFDKIDLFMELGREENVHEKSSARRPTSRASNRMSLPADFARPSTSGSIYARPMSRLDSLRASVDMPRFSEGQRTNVARAPTQGDENASVVSRTQFGRARRCSLMQDRPPSRIQDRALSPSSQASTQFGRRRNTSFDTALSQQSDHEQHQLQGSKSHHSHGSSPPASSDPRLTDSSVESHPADTVWDELDELKSRIKNLESGGKPQATPSAAASGESSERPRTATTAPTTIDSSPKNTRKPNVESQPPQQTVTPPSDHAPASSATVTVHPLLQDALARAKTLLSSSVYRSLEAIATDSMQLAASAGGVGPQSSNLTSVSTQDRHARRKADNICRGLTDLCIALCDNKQEATPNVPTPDTFPSSATRSAPFSSLRNIRSTSLAANHKLAGRPQSRLEARRSSLLASLPRGELESTSPRGSFGADTSASEPDSTPTHSNILPPRRLSAAPQGALRSRRIQEEPITEEGRSFRARAPSRAMTEIGGLRVKSRLLSEDRSPGAQRRVTPSLRETSLAMKRNNDSVCESTRRKLAFENTPPLLEEEVTEPDAQQRRFVRKAIATDIPSRRSSLKQHRRQVPVE